ncbi:MAG: FAD-binding oxidoreductase [Reyranellaceae bacterium]
MDIAALRKSCRGVVAARGDEGFPKLLHDGLWNRLIPDRAPDVLVRVAHEQDVVAAVRFARANGLKVVVRGGGHNWCQPTLRRGGLLIDLSDLGKVISVDVDKRRAVIQPIISNRQVQQVLNAKGLSFPSGHCPEVKVSGYLLGGGMSWNQTVWGTGTESIEAIEMVTPQGELITASATENADWFWAARGSGSAFFGVVTRYHLRLQALPAGIHGSTYYFSLDDAATVARWLGGLARDLSPAIELSVFLIEAPAELKARTAAQGGKVCMVTATAFAESKAEAEAMLRPLEGAPAPCLSQAFAAPLNFEQMFDLSGGLWPSGLRNRVEAMFADSSPGDLVAAVSQHVARSPSPLTVVMFVIYAGPPLPLPDAAFSMNGAVYGGPWTMWREASEDAVNVAWHEECVSRLLPLVRGHYIGESDSVRNPTFAAGAFSPANWQRLAALRARLDPEGLFFAPSEGL